ncbi:hypothetical protein, conserved [Eimeria brunetti]|uniref:Uncharacterized protein n=1 Tax=Eimeria brunetti TaxID=51314 RepID=U6L783_9EIME|nr:hypothetical protein, conserved [Eimeria brunetti]
MFAAVSQTRPRRSLQPSAAVQQSIKSSSSSSSGSTVSSNSNVGSMDVEAKIGCSLDELIKMQRRGPRGPSNNTTQNGAAPQRINRRGGQFKKPLKQQQKPQRQQQQVRFNQRPTQQQQQQQQQQNRYDPRGQQQKQQQKSRTLSVEDKINLPLDALIASQRQPEQQPHEQQAKRQPQQQQKVRPAAFSTAVSGRRGAFLVPLVAPRRGWLNAAVAAAAATRPPLRSAASKARAVAATRRGERVRTLHQQTVKTLKPAGTFKTAAARRSRSSILYPRAAAAPVAAGAGRLASGRLQLRQPAVASYAGTRVNTSLARRRQFGSAAAATAAAAAAAAAASAARSTTGPSAYTSYRTSPPAVKSIPVDRTRPPNTLKAATAAAADPPSPRSFAADADMLPIIKIQASLDTVPAPLPQQRGAHVAIPAAMQREQQQQQQQTPSRSVGATADFGTLGSRFGY